MRGGVRVAALVVLVLVCASMWVGHLPLGTESGEDPTARFERMLNELPATCNTVQCVCNTSLRLHTTQPVHPDPSAMCLKGGLHAPLTFFLRMQSLLPPKELLSPPYDDPSAEAMHALLRHAFRKGCTASTAGCVAPQEYGIGALITGFAKTVTAGLAEGQEAIRVQKLQGAWSTAPGGRNVSFRDFFERGMGEVCTVPQCRGKDVVYLHVRGPQVCRKVSNTRARCSGSLKGKTSLKLQTKLHRRHPSVTPSPFWGSAHAISYLLASTTDRVVKAFTPLAAQLDSAPRPVLGVHIRRGDACTDPDREALKGRNCSTFDEYLPHIHEMVRIYGFRTVYLATDDNSIRNKAQSHFPGLTVIAPRWTTPTFMKDGKEVPIEKATFDPLTVGTQSLAEIQALGRCDGFVGKFTSNLFRVAYMLASFRDGKGCVRPVKSLDAAWCLDFGVNSGVNCQTKKQFFC
eukprot:Sspe_Gene.112716::Locus_95969_Transcript_1_1_Confidence_1.000_Length_1451::g.112716::m.112716